MLSKWVWITCLPSRCNAKGLWIRRYLKRIMRGVAQKLKQGLAYVGKRALKTNLESLGGVAAGGDLKSSLKRRVQQNLDKICNKKLPLKRKVTEKKISIKPTAIKKGCRGELTLQRDIFSQNDYDDSA